MTTKTTTKTARQETTPTLMEIGRDKLVSNPWQPRKTLPTDEELGDLLNSIKAIGQKTPILVRPHPTKAGIYEVADGAMRVAVQRRLHKPTILAMVEPLTDRQMKIFALAQNVFVRLKDNDKEKAVYNLWATEFKPADEAPRVRGERANVEFRGVREMERETGMDHSTITGYLQAHAARELVGHQPVTAL